MRELIKTAVPLFIITVVAALFLGAAHAITLEPIEDKKREAETEAVRAVFPETRRTEPIDIQIPEGGVVTKVLRCFAADRYLGEVAVFVSAKGYGGSVDMMVGIDAEGVVAGVEILSHTETPGLGANAANEAFKGQFRGKGGQLSVTKTAPKDNEIEAITSATITSRAVTNGVNGALDFYDKYIRGAE